MLDQPLTSLQKLPLSEQTFTQASFLFPPLLSPRKKGLGRTGPAGACLRAAGDELHEPATGSAPGRWVHRLASSAQPAGFERRLFSPRSARRDRTTAWFSLPLPGRCGFALNATPQDADAANTHPLRLLDSRSPSGRESISSELDQKLSISISAAARQVQPTRHPLRAAPSANMPGVIHSHHVSPPHAQSTREHA